MQHANGKPRSRTGISPIGKRAPHSMTTSGLVLIGVGGIIGAGFFLGVGLPIRMAGPAILISFVIGALVTAQVTGAVTSIAVNHPTKGSFQVYANQYIGRYAGFMQGWVYYLTSILTISSEAVAMAIFTKLWLPWLPTVVTASLYGSIIVVINAFGVESFERVESVMSVVKIGALVGFVVYGVILLAGAWGGSPLQADHLGNGLQAVHGTFAPMGFSGVMQSMLVVIFAYAGIGVFASATAEMHNPRSIDRAALLTVIMLAVLYISSVALVVWMIPWNTVNTSRSPFVAALQQAGIPGIATILNGVVLIASFSVMAGALYSANQVLYSLGQTGEAPKGVTKETHRGTPYVALIVSTLAIALSLVVSVLLPANLYNFLISASSFFTFFNWFLILWTFLQWRRLTEEDEAFTSVLTFGQPISIVVTMIVLLVLAGYALLQRDQRMGFYASLAIGLILSISYAVFGRRRSKTEP